VIELVLTGLQQREYVIQFCIFNHPKMGQTKHFQWVISRNLNAAQAFQHSNLNDKHAKYTVRAMNLTQISVRL
jgi:hypothetical protein